MKPSVIHENMRLLAVKVGPGADIRCGLRLGAVHDEVCVTVSSRFDPAMFIRASASDWAAVFIRAAMAIDEYRSGLPAVASVFIEAERAEG